jgi:cytochrome b561
MAKAGSYTGTAKSLHWLIVVLLIAQFIFAWTMPHIGRNTPVSTLISLHFTFGIIILIVAVVRLGWRFMHASLADAERAHRALAALFSAFCCPAYWLD